MKIKRGAQHWARKSNKSKFTKAIVAEWRRVMKDNSWNAKQLSKAKKINYQVLCRVLYQDAIGELE